MWKVVITEIQDASTLDPIHAPPGAFFVNTERFSQTVDHLDLPAIISIIKQMQCSSPGHPHENRETGDEKFPHYRTGVEQFA